MPPVVLQCCIAGLIWSKPALRGGLLGSEAKSLPARLCKVMRPVQAKVLTLAHELTRHLNFEIEVCIRD